MRTKSIVAVLVFLAILALWHTSAGAAPPKSGKGSNQTHPPGHASDSRELQYQDMLSLILLPLMDATLAPTYDRYLKTTPLIYPYDVDFVSVERKNGFRGFDFLVTVEAMPVIGPHITVGKDRYTFEISPTSGVKLLQHEHLANPRPEEFPPNYKDLLK